MKTITEFANKCLHEMNTGELTTTECVAKYLDLWHREKNKFITDRWPSHNENVIFKLRRGTFIQGGISFIRVGIFLDEDEWGRKNMFCDGAYHPFINVDGWFSVTNLIT